MSKSNTMREGLTLRGDTMCVDFWYPRADSEPKFLQVGLYDVRAADDIRIHYDFDRDGWAIEQAWIEEVEITKPGATYRSFGCIDRWEEVAFVKAWGLNAEKGQVGPGTEQDE